MEVRNRFKGLDLIDRVPDELWNEVRDIVQETGIKTIPMEKKCKKVKWLSEQSFPGVRDVSAGRPQHLCRPCPHLTTDGYPLGFRGCVLATRVTLRGGDLG